MAPNCWALVFASMMTLGLSVIASDPVALALEGSKLLNYVVLYEEALVRLDMENTVNVTNQPLNLTGGKIDVSSFGEANVCNNTIMQTEGIPWLAGNSSMYFNSSTSYVKVHGTADSGLCDGMTVSLWIKHPPEGDQSCKVIGINISSNAESTWYIKLKRSFSSNGSIYKLHDGIQEQPLLEGHFSRNCEWNMISFVINTKNISMFENGAHGNTAGHNFLLNGPSYISLTLNGDSGEGCSDLQVDEVALWDRPLNMTELITLRIQPFNTSCPLHDANLTDYLYSVREANIVEASDSFHSVSAKEDFTSEDVAILMDIINAAINRSMLTHPNLPDEVKLQNREDFIKLHSTIFFMAEKDVDIERLIDPVFMIEQLEDTLSHVYFSDFEFESEKISTPFVETTFQTFGSTDEDTNLTIDGKLSVTVPSGVSDSADSRRLFVMVFDETISSQLSGESDSMISTHILSIQVSGPKSKFTEPIRMTFTLNDTEIKQVSNNKYIAKCSYLSLTSSTWETDGVLTEIDKSTGIVTCKTYHLTNFAVLLSPTDLEENATLSSLTYILLTISMICLLLTFLVLACLREIGNSQRIQILKHFIIALFIAQALFVFTTDLMTFSKPLCKLSVVLSHYFWVATFTWMLVQGVQLYTKVRRVVGARIKQLFYVIFAWGFPLPVAVLPVLVFGEYYENRVTGVNALCWIPKELVWFLAVPLMVIFVVNLGVTILVMKTFLTVKVNKDKTNTEKLKSSMRAVIVMVPVLGLTWAFGFLLIVDQSQFFQYIFVILNCLQGVFVFLFHLVMNEDVRSAVLRRRNKVASSAENTIFTKVPRKTGGEQTVGGTVTDSTKAPIPSDSSSNL